eukprot:m.210665 g.210665  ORF g.210665 m.210665 type:complete len:96 (+) comp15486_c0_seq5:351-638(+)
MVYCVPFFVPLLLLAFDSESITQPFLLGFLLFTLTVHRPCLQCTVLYAVTALSLCATGFPQYCVLPFEGLSQILGVSSSVCHLVSTDCPKFQSTS